MNFVIFKNIILLLFVFTEKMEYEIYCFKML